MSETMPTAEHDDGLDDGLDDAIASIRSTHEGSSPRGVEAQDSSGAQSSAERASGDDAATSTEQSDA